MKSKIVKEDLILLERIFIECYLKEVLKSPARNLENHVVNFIEFKFKKGEEFTLEELILQLTNEILILGNVLKDKYDDFELMSSPKIRFSEEKADPIETIKISQLSRSIDLDDATHLSSMKVFEKENDVKAVFVTSDYGILNYKIDLNNKFNIKCSNPLYAVHNF